jgi:hypothetical protein
MNSKRPKPGARPRPGLARRQWDATGAPSASSRESRADPPGQQSIFKSAASVHFHAGARSNSPGGPARPSHGPAKRLAPGASLLPRPRRDGTTRPPSRACEFTDWRIPVLSIFAYFCTRAWSAPKHRGQLEGFGGHRRAERPDRKRPLRACLARDIRPSIRSHMGWSVKEARRVLQLHTAILYAARSQKRPQTPRSHFQLFYSPFTSPMSSGPGRATMAPVRGVKDACALAQVACVACCRGVACGYAHPDRD